MVCIPKDEYNIRVARLREEMAKKGYDACLVYGDEYRRENIRYIANIWPIFERAAVLVGKEGNPIVLGAPEGELLLKEMSAFDDIRLLPEFTCVTVPDEIEYPFANYTTFKSLFKEIGEIKKIGIVGIDAMSKPLYDIIAASLTGIEIEDANDIFFAMRLSKSESEVKCLLKAIEIADKAYTELMRAAKPGVTELYLAGVAVGECMKLGAENVPFCLVTSGERVKTIIGRASNKVVEEGDMVMAALAVQYEGYIASFNFPFVVGKMSPEQRQLIDWLIGSYESAIGQLKAGNEQCNLVKAVKKYFADNGLSEYDLYPPLHGCGLSEAESPYPNENVHTPFVKNMTVNTDISLFGHPYGSNRIEVSFIVTEDGYESPSILFKKLISAWKDGKDYTEVL
ncbi:MAG: aminopeptidase P family protein [Clostridia bacterium]|nr:aminopeptidase P family protein [Clostridia bacterium]